MGAYRLHFNDLWRFGRCKLPLAMVVLLIGVAVACSSAGDTGGQPPSRSDPPASTGPLLRASQTVSAVVDAVTLATESLPSASEPAVPIAVTTAERNTLLAEITFVHDGFRTQVTDTIEGIVTPSESAGRTLVVSLENLSSPSSGLNTRATINFGDFDNYIEIPTESGPLRLHLHRDGTLQPEADPKGFT